MQIQYSASATMNFVDPENRFKTSLLALNASFIGGAMVVLRALIYGMDLTVVSPAEDIMKEIEENVFFDLVSLVPMQFNALEKTQINQFNTILVGGAPLDLSLEEFDASVYSTYGMTETVSHIALRKINEELFKTTGDTEICQNDDSTLSLRGSISNHKWIKTNDIIEYHSKDSFKWLGRKDFVINSGGIKLNPESVEKKLRPFISCAFVMIGIPDEHLGTKAILLAEGCSEEIDFSSLDRYEKPKEVFFSQKLVRTMSGKLDRKKTRELFLKEASH